MKYIPLALLPIFVLLAVSCHREELDYGRVNVHFDVAVTDLSAGAGGAAATKAAGDGLSATQLLVGVLDAEGNPLEGYKQVVVRPVGENFSFDLKLLENMEYQVLFFAQSENYYIPVTEYMESSTSTAVLRTVPLRSSPAMNSDAADAFAGVKSITSYEPSQSITLTRIGAQVNVASFAAVAAGTPVTLSVSKVPMQYDVVTGEASGEQTVTLSGMSSGGPSFVSGGAAYYPLAYGYVPVGKGGATVDVTVKVNDDIKAEVASVPLKPNYKTNIMGDI